MSRVALTTLLTWTLALGISGPAAADDLAAGLFAGLVPGEAMAEDELATVFGAGILSGSDSSVTSFAISGASGTNLIRTRQLGRRAFASGGGLAAGGASPRVTLPSVGSMRFFFDHPNAKPIPFLSSF